MCWQGALQGAAGLSLLSVKKGQQGREDSECAHVYVVAGDQMVYSLHISAAVCDVTSGRDTGGKQHSLMAAFCLCLSDPQPGDIKWPEVKCPRSLVPFSATMTPS